MCVHKPHTAITHPRRLQKSHFVIENCRPSAASFAILEPGAGGQLAVELGARCRRAARQRLFVLTTTECERIRAVFSGRIM